MPRRPSPSYPALVDAPSSDARRGLPTVAVVGRPNVGKSTLLNRIVGRREAIVEERPGVTRDRKEVMAEWSGRDFVVVDTGGWMPGGSELDEKVSRQAERTWLEADIVLVVVDTTVGVTLEDERVAERVRKGRRPETVFLVANKVDGSSREHDIWGFTRLGLGDPWPVSALHGRNVADLLDEILTRFPPRHAEDDLQHTGSTRRGGAASPVDGEEVAFDFEVARHDADEMPDDLGVGGGRVPAIVVAGRPNVGKSTLFNRLIGDERSIVHDLPGTTRDSIDTVVRTDHGEVRFVDTAGMRRKSRIEDGPEYFSLVRALQSIDDADAALLVIDATEGVTQQDIRLAERIDAAGCPIVIVLNKWELLDADTRAETLNQLDHRLGFLSYAPVLKLSAKTGLGVHKLLPALGEAVRQYHVRVPTRELNKVIADAQASHPAREARILYATQGATDPPTFTLFANRELSAQYLRYLERKIREQFGFGATPIKLRVRRRGD